MRQAREDDQLCVEKKQEGLKQNNHFYPASRLFKGQDTERTTVKWPT